MASRRLALAANAPGDFFVDSTCIDCEACMWIAPETFGDRDDQSFVHHQPATPAEERRALMALVACPTASIGVSGEHDVRAARDAFPDPIEGGVHHAGYHAESSFGAASYLIVRAAGNVLVDSPRFAMPLVRNIEALGGVDTIFLTHRDDVADFAKFKAHFGAKVVLHARDAGRSTRGAELLVEGDEPYALAGDLLLLPVPGHTAGSMCLIDRGRFLFSGDHLAFAPWLGHPYAFRGACWYDWKTQIRSMERLAEHDFEWILPGHGRPGHLPREEMRRGMEACIAWMKRR